jgi:hypothetical protein
MIAGLTSAGDNLSVCVPGYDTWLVFRKDVVVPEIMTCAQFADFERDVARTGEPLWTVQHQSVDDSLLVRRFVGGLLHGTKFDEPGECSVHDRTITRRIWFAEGRECEADDEPDPERAESVPAF